jgi:protein-disulfide isomerase
MSAQKSAKPGQDNFTRNLVIVMVTLVVLVLVGPLVYSQINKPEISQKIPSAVSVDKGYAISFNKDLTGVPVVDIYEDFQCPICQQFEGVQMKYIDSLITDKKATVHFHLLSFIGQESIRAANASACAADEGKFIPFHNNLYANQPANENSGEWTNDRLIAIGNVAGITSTKFKKCVNNGEYLGWVAKSAVAGEKAGVTGTPTVFVNGKEINRNTDYFSADKFKAAVEG